MTKLMTVARQFHNDEDGAAMVEYSILIGIIAAASILVVLGIGNWVNHRFTGLCTAMSSGPGTCSATGGTGS